MFLSGQKVLLASGRHFLWSFLLFPCFVFADLSLEQLLGLNRDKAGFISCEELTDQFCRTLWSSENLGNFVFSDGSQVLYGSRKRRLISNAQFIHFQKLVKSRCHLPEDIKSMMGIHCGASDAKTDILAELDILLSQVDSVKNNKRSFESWWRSVDRIRKDFKLLVKDTAYERTVRKYPGLSKKVWEDYSIDEKRAFNENYYDIKTEIMNSVYLKDLQWQKVIKMFKEAREDVLTIIDKTVFDPGTKQLMKEKIKSVTLSLPYEDPRFVKHDSECVEYEKNAYYNLTHNNVSFCIGSVNSNNNEGYVYGTLVHEIAHSVDPKTFLQDIFERMAMARLLKKVYKSNASLPCEDWEREKARVFLLPSEIYQLPEKFDSLDQCLVDRRGLSELNLSSLDYASSRLAEQYIHFYARSNRFSYLTTSEMFESGILKKNELYFQPKFFAESENEYLEEKYFLQGYFHSASVFIQEYKCRLLQPGISEEQAFAESLRETKNLNKIYWYYYSSILGRNSIELVNLNLSKPSSEDFADWVAYKAMELKLKRIYSLEDKRIFVLSGTAHHCEPEDLERIAKHKTSIEKRYSRNYHSPNRDRRLNVFTPQIAEALKCTPGEDVKKLNKSCEAFISEL